MNHWLNGYQSKSPNNHKTSSGHDVVSHARRFRQDKSEQDGAQVDWRGRQLDWVGQSDDAGRHETPDGRLSRVLTRAVSSGSRSEEIAAHEHPDRNEQQKRRDTAFCGDSNPVTVRKAVSRRS
jgi:hypothetical protein